MEPLADVIRNISIFSALSREDVAKVLGKMEETVFPGGATIFAQGEQGEAFYSIQWARCKWSSTAARAIRKLSPSSAHETGSGKWP